MKDIVTEDVALEQQSNKPELILPQMIRPDSLKKGDKVAIITPAYGEDMKTIQLAKTRLEQLGLVVVLPEFPKNMFGPHMGDDAYRAQQFNHFFADPSIKALFSLRGGWGCARILDKLDYEAIRKNPKIIIGYSDLTSLLNVVHQKTGLVTFHGPVLNKPLSEVSDHYLKKVLFEGGVQSLDQIRDLKALESVEARAIAAKPIVVIRPGVARGELIGGNLTILISLLGTPYQPDFKGKILFLEDVNEKSNALDRMLLQLRQAGVFDQISGLIIGSFSEVSKENRLDFSTDELIRQNVADYKFPVFRGALIGHQPDQYTLPIGLPVEMVATEGTITLLESPVVNPIKPVELGLPELMPQQMPQPAQASISVFIVGSR